MLYLQTVLDGLLQGGVYAAVAVGLSLVFGVMRIINWAHGEMLMLSMYVGFFLYTGLGINPYITVLINAVLFFALGYLFQRGILNPMLQREKEREPMSILLFTVGLGYVLSNIALMAFGGNSRAITKLIACVISIAVSMALFVFLQSSEQGRALRACSQNREVAKLMGINEQKLYGIAMGLGLGLVGISGALLISYFPVTPEVGASFSTKSFVIVVLGGKGSIPGALVGGLLVGVIETLGSQLFSSSYSQVILFVLFVIILLVKPTGLFGKERD